MLTSSSMFFLFFAVFLVLFLAFWCIQLAWVMNRTEADLGYRHDKWIWLIVFICFGPLAPFVVLIVRLEHGTARRAPAAAKPAKPASPSKEERRIEFYRKKYEQTRRRLHSLQGQLEAEDADDDQDDDGTDDEDSSPPDDRTASDPITS
jgi:hypothetical protein